MNSVEFFIQALTHFEGEASGQLSLGKQSPASPVASSNPILEINAIKTALIQNSDCIWRKLSDESTSTPDRPSGPLLEEKVDNDPFAKMSINAISANNKIIGTNSSLTSEFQMSDPNLRWLKNIILAKKTNK